MTSGGMHTPAAMRTRVATVFALGVVVAALSACGGGGNPAAATTGLPVSRTATSSDAPGSGATTSSSSDTLQVTPPPSASGPTPTAVADPCALIPSTKLYSEFKADPSTSRLDTEKQAVSGNEGCIYDLSGASSVEVILSIVSASQVDTSSSGGLTVAGHPAAYRQTEGGAAEFDVVVSSTDAFTLSVNVGAGTAGVDSEKPQAQDLSTTVAGAYH